MRVKVQQKLRHKVRGYMLPVVMALGSVLIIQPAAVVSKGVHKAPEHTLVLRKYGRCSLEARSLKEVP